MCGQSFLLMILLRGLWEEKDFLTLPVCPGFPGHSPSLPASVGHHPTAGETEVAQKMLEEDQCQVGAWSKWHLWDCS